MNTMSLTIENNKILAILRKDKKTIEFIKMCNSYKELKKIIKSYDIKHLVFDSDFLIEGDKIIAKDYFCNYYPRPMTTKMLLEIYK